MKFPPSHAYKHSIKVAENDIDELGHANNVVYLKWVQEAAAAHWNAVASDQMKSEYAWVVLRHELDYHGPAFVNEMLTAYTWVANYEGATSDRYVKLYRADKILATAKTTWCLLNTATMRPKRIESDIKDLLIADRG